MKHAPLRIRDIRYFLALPTEDELRRVVLRRLGDSVWQTSARVRCTISHIYRRVARFSSLKTAPNDGSHVRVLDPRLQDKWADRFDNDDRVVVLRCDCLNQRVPIQPCRQVIPVRTARVMTIIMLGVVFSPKEVEGAYLSPTLPSTVM